MTARNSFFLLLLLSFTCLGFASCKEDPDDPQKEPIVLNCDDFQTAMTLADDPDLPVDYIINCVMDVAANVTVNPGVVIEFGADAGINVTANGAFKAVGTSAAPITMRGQGGTTGSWKGLLFNSSSANNQLDNVILRHAGSSTFNTNNDTAAVVIWADAQLSIRNCEISNSGNFGVSAIYTNSNWSISNTRITSCVDAPVTFLAPYLASFDGSNDFSGNSKNYLLLDLATQSIQNSLTWRKSNVPYRITSTYSLFHELLIEGGTLTIEAGTDIQMEDGNGIWVDENAALVAVGTAQEKITFSGTSGTPGGWSAIYFDANTTTNNELRHVNISDAGATLDGENTGILMRVNPTLTLDNITFSEITGCSIFNMDVIDNPNLTFSNLTHSNTNGNICHQ